MPVLLLLLLSFRTLKGKLQHSICLHANRIHRIYNNNQRYVKRRDKAQTDESKNTKEYKKLVQRRRLNVFYVMFLHIIFFLCRFRCFLFVHF